MTSACVVFVTASNRKEADKISKTVVKERLAACVNQVPSIRSRYWWKGKVETANESFLIIKTKKSKFEALRKRIQTIHSYAVPEVIALEIVQGNPDYLKWMDESVS
ncbi:MAG: divalent-cation tolerance protein CutA [Elusimicrobia bacterium]|nr:divalent-cation tolerance protein CutA [Elusimicrobiota bacterium]